MNEDAEEHWSNCKQMKMQIKAVTVHKHNDCALFGDYIHVHTYCSGFLIKCVYGPYIGYISQHYMAIGIQ